MLHPLRRLSPILLTLSLGSCLLLCGLWAWSWRRMGYAEYIQPTVPWSVTAEFNGGIVTTFWRYGGAAGYGPGGLTASVEESFPPREHFWPHLREAVVGFHVYPDSNSGTRQALIAVPLWPAILVTAVPPAWWWCRRRHQLARGFPVEATSDA